MPEEEEGCTQFQRYHQPDSQPRKEKPAGTEGTLA